MNKTKVEGIINLCDVNELDVIQSLLNDRYNTLARIEVHKRVLKHQGD